MSNRLTLVIDTKNEGRIAVYQEDDGTIIQQSERTKNIMEFKSWSDWLSHVTKRRNPFTALCIAEFLIKNHIAKPEMLIDEKLSIQRVNISNESAKLTVDDSLIKKYPFLSHVQVKGTISTVWETATFVANQPTLKFIDNLIPKGKYTTYTWAEPEGKTVYGKLLVYRNNLLQEKDFANYTIAFLSGSNIKVETKHWYDSLLVGDLILGIHIIETGLSEFVQSSTEVERTLLFNEPIKVEKKIDSYSDYL